MSIGNSRFSTFCFLLRIAIRYIFQSHAARSASCFVEKTVSSGGLVAPFDGATPHPISDGGASRIGSQLEGAVVFVDKNSGHRCCSHRNPRWDFQHPIGIS